MKFALALLLLILSVADASAQWGAPYWVRPRYGARGDYVPYYRYHGPLYGRRYYVPRYERPRAPMPRCWDC